MSVGCASLLSIGTRPCGSPMDQLWQVVLQTVIGHIKVHPDVELVPSVLFDHGVYESYERVLKRVSA
jgi:O-acetyl-ADP-ribose deacetylase (regulator of RNase III)